MNKMLALFTMVLATASHAWKIEGVVQNMSGSPLQGVSVALIEPNPTSSPFITGADGAFQIGVTSAIKGNHVSLHRSYSLDGNHLILRSPSDELLDVSIFNPSGALLLQKTVQIQAGSARLVLPAEMASSVKFIQMRSMGVNAESGKKLALMGTQTASFNFKLDGYADTTYAMSTDYETNVIVKMRKIESQPTQCPAQAIGAGDKPRKVKVGGVERDYILRIPKNYNATKATPLVLDFHGIGGNVSDQAGQTVYKNLYEQEGLISAFGQGEPSPMNNARGWNYGPCCTDADDVGYAKAIVEDVKSIACVNPKRVYAVGFSNGGGMSHQLACEAADVFAAVAPAAFDLSTQHETTCVPSRPISVMIFRGTDDYLVTYAGGYSDIVPGKPITFLGAVNGFKKWGSINKCTGEPSAADANGCSTYSNCAGGVSVTLCTQQGGQHNPNNANPSVGWSFLKKYTLP